MAYLNYYSERPWEWIFHYLGQSLFGMVQTHIGRSRWILRIKTPKKVKSKTWAQIRYLYPPDLVKCKRFWSVLKDLLPWKHFPSPWPTPALVFCWGPRGLAPAGTPAPSHCCTAVGVSMALHSRYKWVWIEGISLNPSSTSISCMTLGKSPGLFEPQIFLIKIIRVTSMNKIK